MERKRIDAGGNPAVRHEGVPPSNNLIKDGTHRATVFVGPTLKSFPFLFFRADSTGAFMEVKVMDTRKILSAIGTFAVVGAVSTAGAALWTKVLNRKFQMVQLKLTHPKSDKIIFVDFKKAKRGR
ncbi:MAG: hypothetical protein ACLRWH_05560 [Emergencia sp.]|jgi:hypothetical protein|nr:MAG: hypothetical protein BHV93_10705 [Clostridiales bacterium 52_15]UVN08286.1 MAG: hypothetical protein [Bacteriophage sp.]